MKRNTSLINYDQNVTPSLVIAVSMTFIIKRMSISRALPFGANNCLYYSYVFSILLHGSEILSVREKDVMRLGWLKHGFLDGYAMLGENVEFLMKK